MPSIPESFDARYSYRAFNAEVKSQREVATVHITNQRSGRLRKVVQIALNWFRLIHSCWAFASTQVLTDRVCIASGNTKKRLLSPQDLINCDHTCQIGPPLNQRCNNGCSGGYLDAAWKYFKTTGTIGDTCLSYQAADGSCSQTCDSGSPYSSQNTYTASDCYSFDSNDLQVMQAEILTYGPIEGSSLSACC